MGPDYVDSGYVLVDETGEVRNIEQLRRRAYRIMALPWLRRVRRYDARASRFTHLANMGAPDPLLARWAGHTNVRTTKRGVRQAGRAGYSWSRRSVLRGAVAVWGGPHGSGGGIPRGREGLWDMRA